MNAWIREPEILFGIAAVLFQTVDMLLVVATDALFLRRLGTAYLPHAYIAVNLGAVVLVLLLLSSRSLSTLRLSLRMTVALAVTSLACIPFLSSSSFAVFFLVFLVVRLHDKLCFTYFLTYVQGIFPVREAKTKLALILGVSSAASVAAGLSVRPLVVHLSMEALFLASACLSGILVVSLVACSRLFPPDDRRRTAAPENGPPARPLREALGLLSGSGPALARDTVIVFFTATLLRYLIEFQFSRVIAALYPDDASLASFVGSFKAGVALAFTLGQLYLTSRLLVRLRPGGTMALVCAVQLAVSLTASLDLSVIPVFALQALWHCGFHVCNRPALGILFVPLDGVTRDRAGLLVSLADSAGSTLSGIVLLGVQDRVGLTPFFLVVAALYLGCLVVARRLDRGYLAVLESSIAGADAGVKLDSMSALEHLSPDRRRDHLERLVADPDPVVRQEAVRNLPSAGPAVAGPILERLLAVETDPAVLAALVRAAPEIHGLHAQETLRALAGRCPDERSLANLVEAVGRTGTAADAPWVAGFLDHGSTRVRVAAILSAVRLSRDRESLGEALRRTAAMLASGEPALRAAAIVALGEMRHGCFSRALIDGLSDPDEPVRRSAIRVLAKLRPAGALARLEAVARDDPSDRIRQAASDCRRLIEDQKLDETVRLVRHLSAAERSSVGAFLRGTRDAPRLAVLDRLLHLDLPALPRELLDLVRRIEDRRLLELAARCLGPEPPSIEPLLDAMEDARARADLQADALELLFALSRFLGESGVLGPLALRVTAIHLLRLSRTCGDPLPGGADDPERLSAGIVERLLPWIAAIQAPADPKALAKALEGAMSPDRHLASLSLDLLESLLGRELFALIGPVLESGDRDRRAREWLGRRTELIPGGLAYLERHAPERLVGLARDAATAALGGGRE